MKNEEIIKYAVIGASGYLLYNHFSKVKPSMSPTAFLDKWVSRVGSGDPGTITSLYAKDGVLLPTVSSEIAVGKENIRIYFDSFVLQQPSAVIDSLYIRSESKGDVVIMDGDYTFTLISEAEEVQVVPARFTFVIKNVKGDWKILTHHSSVRPV